MPRTPSIAVVIEGGLVQVTLVEDWPGQVPLPHIAIVDYDDDGATDDELTTFNIGNDVLDARCHAEIPSVYESFSKPALSPRAVLRALGVDDDGEAQSPLQIAQRIRQSILDLDSRINATERAPDGSDYNELYMLANCGLIELLKSLGDPSNFGE
ncbi:hypothetical protein HW090_02140 [Pseudomonas sp. ABC1]|uniref:hypothetical protein n=1 Tax=Pseudomonas sp. ABC1 TaxID=2748080 RepID=UPI0015C30834|nr:hypothetical protein [Pseudomonas sp. ABC1]QLF92068.1 hypothetical protein HW090_02140 [Pseudomonas sp. ABC1]